MELYTYVFSWGMDRKFIDAPSKAEAKALFKESYGELPKGVAIGRVREDGVVVDMDTPHITNGGKIVVSS